MNGTSAQNKAVASVEPNHPAGAAKQGTFAVKAEAVVLRLTNALAHHAVPVIVGMLGFALLAMGLVFGGALDRVSGSNGNFWATGSASVEAFHAQEMLGDSLSDPSASVDPQSQEDFPLVVYYRAEDGNMFLKPNLVNMFKFEQAIVGKAPHTESSGTVIKGYEDHCLLVYKNGVSTGCSDSFNIFSVLAVSTLAELEALTQEQIFSRIRANSHPRALKQTQFLFDVGFVGLNDTQGRQENLVSEYTRSRVSFGWPLTSDYNNKDHKEAEQWDKFTAWVEQYVAFFERSDPAGLKINYLQQFLVNLEIKSVVDRDFTWAAVAGSFVYVLMCLMTRSPMLALLGLMNILLAYPIALLLYHGVLQIQVDTSLNLLGLYIILGIGADGIFVMSDAWAQSLHESSAVNGSVERRVYWVWMRAAKALSVTSATTFVAFLMTAFSPIPAISTFGIQSSMMILGNYVMTITFFCAVLVWWSRNFEFRKVWPWESAELLEEMRPTPLAAGEKKQVAAGDSSSNGSVDKHTTDPEQNSTAASKDEAPAASSSETAAPLEPASPVSASSSQVVPETTADDAAADLSSSSTDSSSSTKPKPEPKTAGASSAAAPARQHINFHATGSMLDVADIDIENYRFFERMYYSKFAPWLYQWRYVLAGFFAVVFVVASSGAVYMQPPDSEESFLPPVTEFGVARDIGNLKFPLTTVVVTTQQVFFVWGLDPDRPLDRSGVDSNEDQFFGTVRLDEGFSFGSAADETFLDTACTALKTRRSSRMDATFALDGKVDCWTQEFQEWKRQYGGGAGAPYEYAAQWANFTQFELADGSNPYKKFQSSVKFRADGSVEWFQVRVITPIPDRATRSERQAWRAEFEALLEEIIAPAPANMKNAILAARIFAWDSTSSRLVSSTVQSIVISFAVATVVLLVSSGNVTVALLAAVSMLGIVVSMIGSMVALGNRLGSVESIVATVLVGLSVDYVVHFANAYNENKLVGSFYRGRAALLEMGISVLGGFTTSFASSFVLAVATQMRFFTTFGTVLLLTLSLAFVWANFGFMALLFAFGPKAHPAGDLSYLLDRLRAWFAKVSGRPIGSDKSQSGDIALTNVVKPQQPDSGAAENAAESGGGRADVPASAGDDADETAMV